MSDFRVSMAAMLSALNGLRSPFPNLFPEKKEKEPFKKRVKKVQKQGVVFKSRQILPVTPAEYRRKHMGSQK